MNQFMNANRVTSSCARRCLVATAIGLASLATPGLQGGVVTLGDPVSPAGGISYEWTVQLGADDTVEFARWVGAWSWEDNDLTAVAGVPVGWTHASDFVALTLTEAQTLTIRLERNATPMPSGGTASIASMNPSFTIWSEWDNTGGESHQYNNDRKPSWADVFYVGHVKNDVLAMVEASYVLPAGNYTIALGSNAPADDAEDQGYKATFTTSAVPEPASASFLAAGILAVALKRRRKLSPSATHLNQ